MFEYILVERKLHKERLLGMDAFALLELWLQICLLLCWFWWSQTVWKTILWQLSSEQQLSQLINEPLIFVIKRFYFHTIVMFLHFMPITSIWLLDCVLHTTLPKFTKFPKIERVGQALLQFLSSPPTLEFLVALDTQRSPHWIVWKLTIMIVAFSLC